MQTLFISYSSKDREFAMRLADDLARISNVWIDREGLQGGLEWEQAIESAIKECVAFLIVISPDSNNSDWVARETILAEKLGKYRVPILYRGELPFRLLNVHYVDFQGNYEGGFKDLLLAIKDFVHPQEMQREEVNRLLGAGIRAHLGGKHDDANGLIGQALALDEDIAPSVELFWQSLLSHPTGNLAASLMPHIRVVERTQEMPRAKENDPRYWLWNIGLDATDEILNQIDYVQYQLHPTFANPIQIVRARATRFRLSGQSWGTFPIPIEIHFKDGTVGNMEYMLTFKTN